MSTRLILKPRSQALNDKGGAPLSVFDDLAFKVNRKAQATIGSQMLYIVFRYVSKSSYADDHRIHVELAQIKTPNLHRDRGAKIISARNMRGGTPILLASSDAFSSVTHRIPSPSILRWVLLLTIPKSVWVKPWRIRVT